MWSEHAAALLADMQTELPRFSHRWSRQGGPRIEVAS